MAQETLRELARSGLAQALQDIIHEVAVEIFRTDPSLREKVRTAVVEAFEEMSQPKAAAGLVRRPKR